MIQSKCTNSGVIYNFDSQRPVMMNLELEGC